MTMVVTEPCQGCKHKRCVQVCPCDSFHEGPEMLVINPDSCIDCSACIPECPEQAIFFQDDVPKQWLPYVELNAQLSRVYPVAM